MRQPSSKDLELISTYLDGQLSERDRKRLEQRLADDPNLRTALEDLRRTRLLLQKLPRRRVPRNFTLTRQMAGLRAPTPQGLPTLRLASVLATLLFVIVISADIFRSQTLLMAQAPQVEVSRAMDMTMAPAAPEAAIESAPAEPLMPGATATPDEFAFGMGGGGGGVDQPPGDSTAPGGQSTKSFPAVTPTAGGGIGGGFPPDAGPELLATRPSLFNLRNLEIFFLVVALVTGGTAFYLHRSSEQRWLSQSDKDGKSRTGINPLMIALLVVVGIAIGVTLTLWVIGVVAPAPVGSAMPGDKGNFQNEPFSVGVSPENPSVAAFSDPQGLMTVVDIPVAAVTGSGEIMVIPGLVTEPPDLPFAGHAFALQPSPKSLQLASPITISITYSDIEVQGLQEDQLHILFWDGADWRDAAGSCQTAAAYQRDLENNLISVQACALGSFGLFAFVP